MWLGLLVLLDLLETLGMSFTEFKSYTWSSTSWRSSYESREEDENKVAFVWEDENKIPLGKLPIRESGWEGRCRYHFIYLLMCSICQVTHDECPPLSFTRVLIHHGFLLWTTDKTRARENTCTWVSVQWKTYFSVYIITDKAKARRGEGKVSVLWKTKS